VDVNKYTLNECGTVRTLSLYVNATTGGSARMALYRDAAGVPDALIAESAAVAVSIGWNEIDIPDVLLAAGDYWIGLQTETGVVVAYDDGVSGDDPYISYPFGAFPAALPVMNMWNALYSMYANYCPSGCPSPTATPTETQTFTISPTPIPPCVCPDELGTTYMAAMQGAANGYVFSNWYPMTEDGTATSMELYIKAGSGDGRLAVYSNTLAGLSVGLPDTLVFESAPFAVSVGWNTVAIPQTVLQANTIYWLAFQTQNDTIMVAGETGAAGDLYYRASAFGNFPGTFGPGTAFTSLFSMHINYCPVVCPATPTSTVVNTPTQTATTVPGGSIVSSIAAPETGVVGQQVTIIMTVFNNGIVAIDNISASALAIDVSAALNLYSAPSAVISSLAPGAVDTFTWVYDVTAAAPAVTLSGNASGFNTVTSAPVSSAVTFCVPVMACLNPTATFTATPTVTLVMVSTNTYTATRTYTRTFTPTFTFTVTATNTITPTLTFTPTITATRTGTPTATMTQQNTPVTLEIVNNESVPYPNPVRVNVDLKIRFELNRSAEKAEFCMFTPSQRKIRKIEFTAAQVINNLHSGNNHVIVSRDQLSGLAAGVYYYYISAENSSQKVRSKVEKIIVIK
jgi:hypothetical protein